MISCRSVLLRTAVALLLGGIAQVSYAAGFIASTHIDRGDLFTEVTIRFNCNVRYISHEPGGKSDALAIFLEPTSICHGFAPSIADNREIHRPLAADDASIEHIEYDGESAGRNMLRISFSEDVTAFVSSGKGGDTISVRVFNAEDVDNDEVTPQVATGRSTRQVRRSKPVAPKFVINLESSQRYPAPSEIPVMTLDKDQSLFISEAKIDGNTWYRMRIGYFASAEAASRVLREIRAQYPTAWIDREPVDDVATESRPEITVEASAEATPATGNSADLMVAARHAMTAGELSKAIQIYTKVLQQPPNDYQQQAQEFLALARERNGQIAHAKAEYQRYLAHYPDGDDAARVQQRLAALLAVSTDRQTVIGTGNNRKPTSRWKVRSFLSQHYRRDVNQLNDQDEIVSQSSIYSDITVDARRRGERFDFSTRLTGGYRYDLLDEDQSTSGNDFRLSYLYADLLDTRTRIRGRLGRQTRNTGGVLGRFDGLNITYSLTDRVRFETVAGKPVFSTAKANTQSRQFYGVSSNFAPFSKNLEFGVFYLQQDIDSLTDRQAVGAEMRYFGETKSIWGSVDYDTAFSELGSAFLHGSWRLPGKLTISGSVDRRHSPFLSLGNALLGQTNQDFDLLTQSLTENEIRQIALDRSAMTSTTTVGLSRPLSPKLNINVNASLSVIDAVPANGDAPAIPEAEYSYYSADLVTSSLFREGDVGILGVRYSTSDSADIYSLSLDSRFPIGRSWRINPRLRVDYREINSDLSTQLTYTPGLRLQYRLGRRGRIDLEAGKQFSSREMIGADFDQESYFVYLGYQLFY